MLPPGYKVKFVCKVCKCFFERVNDYVQHKQTCHFEEFQKNKTIVFEEKTISNPSQSDDPHGQFDFDATIKQETLARDEDKDEWVTDPESTDHNFNNNNGNSCINPNPNKNIISTDMYILPDPECVSFNVQNQNPLSTEIEGVNYSVAGRNADTQDPEFSLLEPKSEATFYDSEYEEDETSLDNLSQSQPSRQIPSVRLTRLTSNEIQNTSFSNLQSSSNNNTHRPNIANANHRSDEPSGNSPTVPAPATNNVSVQNFNFECKLCHKKYSAETDLQLHEKVCASYSAIFNNNAQTSKERILNFPTTTGKDPLILQGNNTLTIEKTVKSTRKTLTTEEKYEILQKLKTQKQSQIIKETGISSSVLCRIKQEKEKITENWLKGRKTVKKHRVCSRPDVDKALFEWFTKERNEGHFVSRKELQGQGMTFALLFDQNDNWQCTSSWIERFRARHNILWKSSLVKSAGAGSQGEDRNMEYQSGLIFNSPYD